MSTPVFVQAKREGEEAIIQSSRKVVPSLPRPDQDLPITYMHDSIEWTPAVQNPAGSVGAVRRGHTIPQTRNSDSATVRYLR